MFLNLAVSLVLIQVGKDRSTRMFTAVLTEIEKKMKIQMFINKSPVKQIMLRSYNRIKLIKRQVDPHVQTWKKDTFR